MFYANTGEARGLESDCGVPSAVSGVPAACNLDAAKVVFGWFVVFGKRDERVRDDE